MVHYDVTAEEIWVLDPQYFRKGHLRVFICFHRSIKITPVGWDLRKFPIQTSPSATYHSQEHGFFFLMTSSAILGGRYQVTVKLFLLWAEQILFLQFSSRSRTPAPDQLSVPPWIHSCLAFLSCTWGKGSKALCNALASWTSQSLITYSQESIFLLLVFLTHCRIFTIHFMMATAKPTIGYVIVSQFLIVSEW